MSIRNTIMGIIVKNAKMNWEHMSEEDADKALDKFQSREEVINNVTYGSEKSAINGIMQVANLTHEEEKRMMDNVYNKDSIDEDIVIKIKTLIKNQGKEQIIIKILSTIHDEWVKNNANKFQARQKDYQFVDLRLLSFEEVKKDLIFLQPILEGCDIEINEAELEKYFLDIQKKYMIKKGIVSHEDLKERLKQGSDFYPILKGLYTNKGIKNGEDYSIEELLKKPDIVEEQARQIENEIVELKTDLHTHLNGILQAETLLALAEKCGINIDNLSEKDLNMPNKGGTFEIMQNKYNARNTLVKKIIKSGMATELLTKIAEEYKKHNIDYAEITANPDIIELIVDRKINIEQIEKTTGVKMRFLLGVLRGNTINEDTANTNVKEFKSERIQHILSNSDYVVGIDIMGSEDHGKEYSSTALKNFLEIITDYAKINEDFIIRLHSGETEKDKSGIKDALKTIKNKCIAKKYPRIRIGHAIHGLDEETINMMKQMEVSIELNLASNIALNNITGIDDENLAKTIRLCQENDIPIYLGTDGYGIYSSSPEEQKKFASMAKVDLLKAWHEELRYLDEVTIREKNNSLRIPYKKDTPKGRISKKLRELEIPELNSTGDLITNKRFKGKIPIIISGSSLKTRADGDFEDYKKIALMSKLLSNVLDPEKIFIITGGTNCRSRIFYT